MNLGFEHVGGDGAEVEALIEHAYVKADAGLA